MIAKVETLLRQYVQAVLHGLDTYCNFFERDYPWLGILLPIAVLIGVDLLLPHWMFVLVSLLIGIPLATFFCTIAWFFVTEYPGRRRDW